MATDTGIASGAIANCTDGADEVPIVKWEVQARSFSGVSSVVANHCNKNLIMPPLYDSNDISLCLDLGQDVKLEKVTMSFLATNAVSAIKNNALVDYRESDGTHHYVSLSAFRNASDGTYFDLGTPQNGIYAATSTNFKFRYIYIYYCQNKWNKFSTNCLSKWQIEVGNTRTDFVKTLKSSDTSQLGRTVYGAKLNLTSGTGTENMVRVKISDLSWTYYTAGTNPIFYAINVPNMKTYARAEMPNLAIDGYTTRTSHSRSYLSTNMANMECSAIENAQTITFRNDAYTSRDDMLAAIGDNYIIYETTQTTDFTFDPILNPKTYLGVNNFWIDCGDSEVEYYKRGYGYTSVTLNRRISKNFIDNSDDAWESGTINASGVNASGNGTRTKGYFPVIGGLTYCISGITAPSTTSDFRLFYYDANKTFLSYRNYSSSWVFPSDVAYIRFRNLTDIDISNLQLEIGSTPSSYEPYSAVTKTAKLHRRIYGGQADVIRGIGSDAYKEMTIKEMGFSRTGDYFQVSRSSVGAGALTNDNIFCTCYQRGSSSGDKVFWYTDSYIRFRDSDYTTVEAMESAVGNESFGFLASTPTAFTFPPVSFDTIEGEQFLFASEGNSALTYRKAVD